MVEFWTEGTLLTPELCGHTLPLLPYLPWSWLALALPNKKTKTPSLGRLEPSSSHVPLFLSPVVHRQTNGSVTRPSCHGPCLRESREGTGCTAVGSPKPNTWL